MDDEKKKEAFLLKVRERTESLARQVLAEFRDAQSKCDKPGWGPMIDFNNVFHQWAVRHFAMQQIAIEEHRAVLSEFRAELQSIASWVEETVGAPKKEVST